MAEALKLTTISLPPATLLQGWVPPTSFLNPTSTSNTHAQAQAHALLDPSRTLLLTASFGHLIPSSLLSLFPPLNALNVHPSLLPKYRGAAPIQRAIAQGEERTGVTVQELSRGKFDRGRVLGQREVSMPPEVDFKTLEPLLARKGADLLVEVLRDLEKAQANAVPQTGVVSLAPKIVRDHARIAWDRIEAEELRRLQRGIGHQFPLWTTLGSSTNNDSDEPSHPPRILQIQLITDPSATPSPTSNLSLPPGSATLDPRTKTLLVRCGGGVVGVEKVKVAGGKWVEGREWWNGVGSKKGVVKLE